MWAGTCYMHCMHVLLNSSWVCWILVAPHVDVTNCIADFMEKEKQWCFRIMYEFSLWLHLPSAGGQGVWRLVRHLWSINILCHWSLIFFSALVFGCIRKCFLTWNVEKITVPILMNRVESGQGVTSIPCQCFADCHVKWVCMSFSSCVLLWLVGWVMVYDAQFHDVGCELINGYVWNCCVYMACIKYIYDWRELSTHCVCQWYFKWVSSFEMS